jgi:hypothetical protein
MNREFFKHPYGAVLKSIEGAKGILITDEDANVECVVAQVYDNFLNRKNRVYRNAALFMHSGVLQSLLENAVDAWPQFDGDTEVSGADLVDWFTQFRRQAKDALQSVMDREVALETEGGIESLQAQTATDASSELPRTDESRDDKKQQGACT